MHRLLDFIRSFDPGFENRIEGASAEEIERLERAVEPPLPRDYRTYLELMGRRDDGLFEYQELDTSAQHVIRFYEEEVARGEQKVPDGCITIAVGGVAIEQACIERQEPCRVFEVANGEKATLWAASLRGQLYQHAFMRRAFKHYEHTAFYSTGNRRPVLHLARAVLDTLELERQWFSDDVSVYYSSDRESVAAGQLADRGFWLRIAMDGPDGAFRIPLLAKRISEAVGAALSNVA